MYSQHDGLASTAPDSHGEVQVNPRKAGEQRLPSVAAGSCGHSAWHEAVNGSPGSAVVSMTGIEGAAVTQVGAPQVPLQ